MKKSKWMITSLAAMMLASSLSNMALACGPFLDEAVLVFDQNPDLPLKNFLSGKIGVIRPTWAKSYLVVAYRTLNSKPFTPEQRDGVYSLWTARITASPFSDSDDAADAGSTKNQQLSGISLWQKTRGKVPGVKAVNIEAFRRCPGDSYDTFLNCPDGSFETASRALDAKIAKHGVSSAFVKDWVGAQDLVFCHCAPPSNPYSSNTKTQEPPFPAMPKDAHDAEVSQDRAYQHAAALFYAKEYDEAMKEFNIISAEPANPYAKISRYMMPRCLIRKATIDTTDKAAIQATLLEAQNLLRTMLADSKMAELHHACEESLNFVLFRTEPVRRLKELSNRLVADDKSVTAAAYMSALDDYTQLLLNLEGGLDNVTTAEKKMPLPPDAKNDDLSDWITVWESDDAKHFTYARDKFHHTGLNSWLLAALHLAPKDKSQSDDLIAAARNVKADNPGYLSIGYESVQLQLRRGEIDDAAREADVLREFAAKQKLPSAVNLVMDARGKTQMDVPRFVENAIRVPAAFSIFDEYLSKEFSPTDPKKAKDSKTAKKPDFVCGPINANIMNERMPLSMVVQVAQDSRLPANIRKDAEQATWARAVVLNDSLVRDKMTPAMLKDYPQLASLLKATQSGTDEEKKFSAAYLMLKNPGMRPYITGGTPRAEQFGKLDEYGDNWWDASQPDRDITYNDNGTVSKSKLKGEDYPKLMNADQLKTGADNKKQLLAVGAAPTYFCGVVADYAAAHKADPRVPEALHLAVRASHYGHREGRTTPLSKKCFQILHTNYPKNTFTGQTPYWY